jgi:hypothetical protein
VKITVILESFKEESSNTRAVATFLEANWGLAVSIKNKLKFKCSNEELFVLAKEAYVKAAETFDEARNNQTVDTKYEFVHHWAQQLKSLIVRGKKMEMREVSYEEILETNPGVLSRSRLHTDPTVPCESTLADIIQMVSFKKAEEIALMIDAGYDPEKISVDLNVPLNQVSMVVEKIDEVKSAAVA